jgi:hypothetical protein
VIKHFDVEQLAGFDNSASDLHVFRRGGRVAGRVVVRQDECRCIFSDGFTKNLADANDGRVRITHINGSRAEDVIFGVEQQYP